MIISISEFAQKRGEDRDTINAWLRHHNEVNKACWMRGKDKVIDTDSYEYTLLEKQYPLPKPVEVVVDTASMEKLIEVQAEFIELQKQLTIATAKIAEAEAIKLLLEDKKEALDKAENRANKAEDKAEALDNAMTAQKAEYEAKIKELEATLEAEKAKTWWQKLRGK